ncbi:MAG: PIN domain-containing protein [Chlamydiota bacterium]
MIFVDTSAWIFLFDQRRGGKESVEARNFYQQNKELLAVTDLIIEETHKWLVHHSFPKEKALEILKKFVEEEFAEIFPIENIDRTTAYLISKKFTDQNISYTDALTVAMMRRTKTREIFSFDTHFDLFPGIVRIPRDT